MGGTGPKIFDTRWILGPRAGEGGMAEVYRGSDAHFEHGELAIKLLPRARQEDRWAIKGFELEVEARLAPLDHPHIVPLLAHGMDPETRERYLVFPWAGRPLAEIFSERGAIPWEEWWPGFGRPLLDALAHAHHQKVAHRDLKPENVLVENGHPWLADFGVAKLLDQLTAGLTLAEHVTRPFAPEEPDRGIHTATRDLHAWAALTVFAVTGTDHRGAVSAEDPYAVLSATALRAREGLPDPVATLIHRCLDQVERRPADGAVLLTQLDSICSTGPDRREPMIGTVHASVGPSVIRDFEGHLDLFEAELIEALAHNLAAAPVLLAYGERQGHYRLVGSDLSLHVAISRDERSLHILGALRLPDSRIERLRDQGWRAPLHFTLDPIEDDARAADAVQLLIDGVLGHRDERARRDRERQRMRPLTKWRGVLGALRELQDGFADPIPYLDVRRSRNSGSMVFTLDRVPTEDILGQSRIAPSAAAKPFSGEVIHFGGEEAVLRPDPGPPPAPLPRGSLEVDTRAALSSLRRQDIAMNEVLYGRAQRRGLDRLLADPARARPPEQVREPRPLQGLDDDKRRALQVALGQPDLLLIEGPPGTGKTRLIAELVCQQLRAEPDSRILLASQTHSAIDNAMLRVSDLDPTVSMLRVARADEERVDERLDHLRIDAQLEDWKREAERSGWAWLRAWARGEGLDLDSYRNALALEALADALDRSRALGAEVERLALAQEAAEGAEAAAITDELRALRAERRSAESRGRDHLSDLIEAGLFKRRTAITRLDPAELRERSLELGPPNDAGARCRKLLEQLMLWHRRFGASAEFEAAALARAQIVGATCVGLGRISNLRDVRFDLCIVDEASRATAPELLIPLARAERFVLVGDRSQLPPYLDRDLRSEELLQRHRVGLEEIEQSFFEHLADGLPDSNVIKLTAQHRMHPSIGGLISECYYGGELTSSREEHPLAGELAAIAPSPVTWVTTAALPAHSEERRGASIANPTEVAVIEGLLERLSAAAREQRRRIDVAVLSGYRAQCHLLDSRLAGLRTHLNLAVSTIDAFQGREAEVVVYSLTRANPRGRLGFVRERPRANVALSRARELLVIVGDHVSARAAGANPIGQAIEYIESAPNSCEIVEAEL